MTTDQTSWGLSRIGQISIRVHDLDRAVIFYRDALGMQFLFEAPGMAFFQCGAVRILLGAAEQPEFDHPASILYFNVDDIHSAYKTLTARGVEFRGEPHVVHRAQDHDLWMAFFHDSEDSTLALMAEMPRL